MKHFYTLLITIGIANLSLAQVPANYYDSANGLSGYTLKTELRDIITNGHNDQGYGALYTGYETTHSDNIAEAGYENDNTVLLFYTENPNGNDPYTYNHGQDQCGNYNAEGVCHNREHLVPQSTFNSASPMQNDIHHVIPSDGFTNGQRGSLPFGTVGSANWTSQNGSKRGSSTVAGYSGTVFEPIDEFKGDVARALLYFAVRYQDNVDSYGWSMFNGTEDQVFQNWAIDMLLDWHYNVDPVDAREIQRNDAAYNFQGNANPFVNHPEYANLIWNPNPDNQAPSDPTNLMASNPSDNSIDLSWTASTDNVAIDSYDIYVDGVFSYNTGNTNTTTTVTGLLANTNYCFTVKAKDTSSNESNFSNQDCETTTDNGSSGGDIDIFFSEYIEGTGSNKALEIANFTGTSITNMSIYTLKLSTNGNAGWGTTYTFPSNASIANGGVYVIANGGANLCSQEDDLNNAITSFNGNDAIGLFKNDVLIDIIGELGNNADFAENVTLVRKPTIDRPTTTFNLAEWNSFGTNDCSDLGSHTQTLSVNNFNIETVALYPNPVKTNLNIRLKKDTETQIEIYDILGKRVYNTVISTSESINLQNLKTGVYIIKLIQNNNSISKRLIKN